MAILLQYATRKNREWQKRSELNGKHQFLVNADDTDLLGKGINGIKKNTKDLLDVNKEVTSEVKAGKAK
jgi:hypothetical protein